MSPLLAICSSLHEETHVNAVSSAPFVDLAHKQAERRPSYVFSLPRPLIHIVENQP